MEGKRSQVTEERGQGKRFRERDESMRAMHWEEGMFAFLPLVEFRFKKPRGIFVRQRFDLFQV